MVILASPSLETQGSLDLASMLFVSFDETRGVREVKAIGMGVIVAVLSIFLLLMTRLGADLVTNCLMMGLKQVFFILAQASWLISPLALIMLKVQSLE